MVNFDPDSFEYYQYDYDLKNRLIEVRKYDIDSSSLKTIASYVYDSDGFRVEKTDGDGAKNRYIFDRDGKILEYINMEEDSVISSVFLKSRHLARVTSDEVLYYGTDHQGTSVLMTDEEGEKIWTSEATPFGDAVVRKTGERDDLAIKYTGKDFDEEVDLYYFNARWYDAETGRFISEDPARDGQNWYVYTSNNPTNRIDPTGLEWVESEEGVFTANEDSDYLIDVAEQAGYDSWSEAAEANYISDFYDNEGSWQAGDFTFKDQSILSKDKITEMKDHTDSVNKAFELEKTETLLDIQKHEGRALMSFGMAGYVATFTSGYLGTLGTGSSQAGFAGSGVLFSSGLDLYASSKNGVLKESKVKQMMEKVMIDTSMLDVSNILNSNNRQD